MCNVVGPQKWLTHPSAFTVSLDSPVCNAVCPQGLLTHPSAFTASLELTAGRQEPPGVPPAQPTRTPTRVPLPASPAQRTSILVTALSQIFSSINWSIDYWFF